MPSLAVTPPTQITLVHAEACHFCTDASRVLDEVSANFPIEVTGVNVASDQGAALVALHRPAMSPLVLVDGAFFSQGRLPRKKLEALLRTRVPAATGCCGGH